MSKPSFIIAGAMKCGTTSLFYNLIQHPKIKGPSNGVKEVQYYDNLQICNNYKKGFDWYLKQFPELKSGEICGEASPGYMSNPFVAERIKTDLPNAKIIIILRDPVDRCYSQYNHCLNKDEEVSKNISFEAVLELEDIRLINNPISEDCENYEYSYWGYKYKSLYVNQIKNILKYFSKEQIKIIKAEDFFRSPRKIVSEVFKFLGLENVSISRHKRSDGNIYEPMRDDTRKYLNEYFKKYNDELNKLIGINWDN